MSNKLPPLLFLPCLTLFLMGCSGIPLLSGTSTPKTHGALTWSKLFVFETGPNEIFGDKTRLFVITNIKETEPVKDLVVSYHFDQLQSVDYSKYIVATIIDQTEGSTGYAVDILDVWIEDQTITIYSKFTKPGMYTPVGPMVTKPYIAIKIRKTNQMEGMITFVLLDQGNEILQTTHSIN